MTIVFLIRSLGLGGAERQLLALAERLSHRHSVVVLTFYDDVEYKLGDHAKDLRFISLDKAGRWDIFGFLRRYLAAIRATEPDVIYCFMSTASVVSLIAARLLSRRVPIVMGIRSSNMRLGMYGLVPRMFRWLECRLSRNADLVIANSVAGREEAIADGFRGAGNILTIPNGIDVERFRSSSELRKHVRDALNIPHDAAVIGTVARHDPMKGLESFLAAAAMHHKTYPGTYFLLVGSGAEPYTATLRAQAASLGLQECFRWVGKTQQVEQYYSAMDVFTSCSVFGEGFSNAIGEAMACGLPCVVTDVGDARKIVAEYGIVVPPGSPHSMALAWAALAKVSPGEAQQLGVSARRWIAEKYGVDAMVEATERALMTVGEAGSRSVRATT